MDNKNDKIPILAVIGPPYYNLFIVSCQIVFLIGSF